MKSILALALLAIAPAASIAAPLPELALKEDFRSSTEPLTTDEIAQLDPGQPNPLFRRWLISRKVNLLGLGTRKLPGGRIGVTATTLASLAESHVRAPGLWYQTIAQLPCASREPDPSFATQESTRELVEEARLLWSRLLSQRKLALAAALSKVAEPSALLAKTRSQRAFQEWYFRLDDEWRARVVSELEPKQWKSLRARAVAQGVCPSRLVAAPKMAPAAAIELGALDQGATPVLPLVHAPSRRWDGYFGVRMDIQIGDKPLTGQFVVDPGASLSTISPSWMIAQGAQPDWLIVKEALPERVRITAGSGATGLGRVAWIEQARISGYPLALTRFLIFEGGEIYDLPDHAATCCSGVLGADFLRDYVVEFHAGLPNEVSLWPLEGYKAPDGYEWVETRETPGRPGIQVVCSPRVQRLNLPRLCDDPIRAVEETSAPIVFDLPHSRIWYSPAAARSPERLNRTGVRLGFDFAQGGDRVLKIKDLGKTPAAAELARAGLKRGSVITQVDTVPAIELDLWEINRRLAGGYGDRVTLGWETKDGPRALPIPTHEEKKPLSRKRSHSGVRTG